MIYQLGIFVIVSFATWAFRVDRNIAATTTTTIHLVPHSHDDVGWVRTIDEYYDEQVHAIYDNVLNSLLKDSRRRFIIVEQAYFQRWFTSSASPQQRNHFHKLLIAGQLEFVNGGWVMHDEASTMYQSMLDQLHLGWTFINSTFGQRYLPKIAFQIDPFGHSATTALLSRQMGFQAVVLNRIDFRMKQRMQSAANLEFLWSPSSTSTTNSNPGILAHILDQHYSAPPGLDFDYDREVGDEEDLRERAQWLINHIKERQSRYPSQHHFLQLIGDDFRWIKAERQYHNWERIIQYVNDNPAMFPGYSLKFSLLSEYFQAVGSEGIEYQTVNHDFFPYADNEHSYWTGYFTSKPLLKREIRKTETLARLADISSVRRLAQTGIGNREVIDAILRDLRVIHERLAETQHHDAITGTSKSYVTEMYLSNLKQAQRASISLIGASVKFGSEYQVLKSLKGDGDGVVIVVIETAHSRPIKKIVEMPAFSTDYEITDDRGNLLVSQIIPCPPGYNLERPSPYLLYVEVSIAPLESTRIQIRRNSNRSRSLVSSWKKVKTSVSLSVGRLQIHYTSRTNKLSISWDGDIKVTPNILAYKSYSVPNQQSSGAYIFRTSGDAEPLWPDKPLVRYIDGPLVKSIELRYQSGDLQIYRLFATQGYQSTQIEVVTILGPIPLDSEVIFRVESEMLRQCLLVGDSNGHHIVPRTTISPLSFAANYYPIASVGGLACTTTTSNNNTDHLFRSAYATVDAPVGYATQRDGELEYMLHRRTSLDDGRGVEEPLNDASRIQRVLRFSFVSTSDTADQNRDFMAELETSMLRQVDFDIINEPVILYSPPTTDAIPSFDLNQSAYHRPLPEVISMQLESVDEESNLLQILVRLKAYSKAKMDNLIQHVLLRGTKSVVLQMEETSLLGFSKGNALQGFTNRLLLFQSESEDHEVPQTTSPSDIRTFKILIRVRLE